MKDNFIVDPAHGGMGWEERNQSHINELGVIWGDCGVKCETAELKSVLLRRPGNELLKVDKPEHYLWTEVMDKERAVYQHDVLSQIYKDYNVAVNFLEDIDAENYPNIIFLRDIFTMIPEGAIISRLASKARSGEERIIAKELSKLNIPILSTIHGRMYLEGPDILLVNNDLALLGIGLRSNIEGAVFVKNILEKMGYSNVEIIQTTYGCGHLDGVVNIINSKCAAIVPQRASYQIYSSLKKHGFKIINLENLYEVDKLMSINFVSVNDEMLLINKGAKDTIEKYHSCGVECIEIDVSELMKGGGSIHCLSGVIKRG